ncbi:MAG TPA: hypothetical protein PL110_00025 [Candidatus Eremiobacteraeota bacterium]|nr:MAG: hypothetical protein BWY64_00255 [bacterium ADurb.Bin363]HPZ06471.1 hypothetical protein [Candidatus Eremiobacteraeota bacterium]
MKKICKFFLLFFLFFLIRINTGYTQLITDEYKLELLEKAQEMENTFHKYQNIEDKYNLFIKANDYMSLQNTLSLTLDPLNVITGSCAYTKYLNTMENFLTDKDEFEQYNSIVVSIRLYTEYFEITRDKKIGKHIAYLHNIQKKHHLIPYMHYGFYKNDIFNFNIATPAFDYFENLSLSCFQIEACNNSTNSVDFSRFKFYIQTLDGKIREEIDLEKNKEFYEELPPMPDGYLFEDIPVLSTDRALKLFPVINNENLIEKVVMQDKLSDFKIESLFFENIKEYNL